MDCAGSMEYVLIWRDRATRSGLRICALRARARKPKDGLCVAIRPIGSESSLPHPIFDNGCSGWVSPMERDHSRGGEPPRPSDTGVPLSQQVALAGYPTPDAQMMNDGANLENHLARLELIKKQGINGNGAGLTLAIVAQLVGFPTPEANAGTKAPKFHGRGTSNPSLNTVASLTGYPSPRAGDADKGMRTEQGVANELARQPGPDLVTIAQMSGWASPDTSNRGPDEHLGWSRPSGQNRASTLQRHASFTVATANSGVYQLNPAMSRWLMGFPANRRTRDWDVCSPCWSSWAIVQRMLSELSARPEATASAG